MQSPTYLISAIYVYPIKSMAGMRLQESELCPTGLLYDRRWMLVNEQNKFLTQREIPQLCLFQLNQTATGFTVTYKKSTIEIPFTLTSGQHTLVTIWDDTTDAIEAAPTINKWFSEHLNQKVKLVYMPASSNRLVDKMYVPQPQTVSFADGYPLLFIGEEALNLLASKTTEIIPMNRFRPNIVFSGGQAHDEDTWNKFRIKQYPFEGVKPCGRCTITTINQTNGVSGAEPLKTLATYRKQEHKILFGQNCIGPLNGTIKVGDEIRIDTLINIRG